MPRGATYELVPRPPLPAGTYLVLGLAKSGQAAVKQLCALGHRVIAVDAAAPAGADTLGDFGAETHLETDGLEYLGGVDVLVKSPGVPQEAALVVAARSAGVPIIGELALGWRLLANPVIAVTGTNGKTTTTELLGQIYRDAGLPVAVAGNVGTPLCDLVGAIDQATTIVVEASSFQIEDAPEFAPECGVLLNIEPDHLDRHKTFAAYRDAKLGMFEHQGQGQFAVVGPSVTASIPGEARKYKVPAPDIEKIGDEIALQGPHNKENALIATQAAMLMGVDPFSISRTLATFAGLPNRMELVAVKGGVKFINDSKATNVAATLAALGGYSGDVHLLLGGSPKGEDYSPLVAAVESAAASVQLNGENGDDLRVALADARAEVTQHGTLAEAFAAAVKLAQPGETVLLSPAAASFDQFANYEARGEAFRQLVAAV